MTVTARKLILTLELTEAFMASEQGGSGESPEHEAHWPTAVVSLIVGAAFLADLWQRRIRHPPGR